MLSEILFASVKTTRDPKSDRAPGISCSSLYPCPYRMYLVHTNQLYRNEELTPQAVLNMEDGWTAETQAVERLGNAGIKVEERQGKVLLGRSKVPGSTDGVVELNGQRKLWEFKAMNSDRFNEFTRWGLRTFINYKAQVNGYMLGKNLSSCWFMAKHKDSNNYFDIEVKLDEAFITTIIDTCDRIRLEGWVPEKKECSYCSDCGVGCFGAIANFSWIGKVDEHEMAEKWRKGKSYRDVGESMMEEAKAAFCGVQDKYGNTIIPGLIGDKEELWVEELRVQKITQHRFDISKQRILEEFGPEGLMKVADERSVSYFKITDKA